jgi:hypothetical protein
MSLSFRAAAALLPALLTALAGCVPAGPAGPDGPSGERLYAVAFSVSAPDGSWNDYLRLTDTLELGQVSAAGAMELAGSPSLVAANGAIYVGSDERKTFTRYVEEGGALVAKGTVSLANEGMPFLYSPDIVSDTQAFSWNQARFELVEWNPTTMTITRRYDLSGLQRRDFGMEWRGGGKEMYRAQDGVLFYYVAYTNERASFANAFHVVLFDTRTGQWELLTDSRCGESAGFGGWVEENGDVYLLSDNFGALGEITAGIERPSCLLRVKAGERRIDPDYLVDLNALIGGRQAWGLYRAGPGVAYTAGLDMARQGEFAHPYDFLFAEIHPFFQVDLNARSASQVTSMRPAGAGYNPFTVEGALLMPRTTGAVTKVGQWEASESAVFRMDPSGNTATELMRVPGSPSLLTRLR